MTKSSISLARLAAAFILAISAFGSSAQQAYPGKPVRLVIPYAPGGSTSVLAMLIARQLGEAWGQQVVVDHRAGGNTTIATDIVAKATPDGYTLLLTSNSHVVIPQLLATPFDPIKDFAPIATVASTELVLMVNPSVPANTLQEFIALARSSPGQINYASAGSSSATHLAGELLATMAAVKIQHVPYKGSGPAISDLVGGQVQASFQTPIVAIPYIRNGKLKALAVTGEARMPAAPQAPTFTEAGLPNFNATTWFGLMAPAGTPRFIIDKVAGDMKKTLTAPEFREKLLVLGLDPFFSAPEQFDALMKSDLVRSGRLIKASNVRLD